MRYYTFVLTLLMSLACMGQGVSPTRDVEATDDGIIVTYRFHGGFHQDDPLHPGAKFWKIPGFALNDVAGEPSYSFHWDTFVVPDDCEVSLTLIDSAYTDTLFTLAPAYPPILMSDTIGYTPNRVPPITAYSGLFPNSSVLKGNNQNYRGQELARVVTMPVQYNYDSHTVRSFSMIKYKVSFTRNGRQVRGRDYASTTSNISISDHFLENTTLNYSLSSNNRQNLARQNGNRSGNLAQLDNRSYLIITTDDFLDAVNEFAEWKRTKGYKVFIESRQQGLWTYDEIKSRISFYYSFNMNSCPLYHVLFVGDYEFVPGQLLNFIDGNQTYNYVSDFNYGINIGESDRGFPVIHRGRIPVKSNLEASIVFHKIIDYEISPPELYDFYRNCAALAYFHESANFPGMEGTRMTLTSEEIRNHLISKQKNISRLYITEDSVNPLRWDFFYYGNSDSIPAELRRSNGFTWSADYQTIIPTINNGNFLVVNNSHGSVMGWGCHQFYYTQVAFLENGDLLPVVFDMSCETGMYNSSIESFAESFLKRQNGGCVAFLGNSNVSFCGTVPVLCEGMIDAIWPGLPRIEFPNQSIPNNIQTPVPTFELGQIMDQGLKVMENQSYASLYFLNSRAYRYSSEVYHLFGDPSMMVYTEKPENITDPEISLSNDTVYVKTTDGSARISFHTTDNYYYSSYIGTEASFKMRNKDVIICIDRHNYIPYVVRVSTSGFIQNEIISDSRIYSKSSTIKIGRNVTTTKPEGDVLFDGADVKINGGTVEIHPGTTIINSNVRINVPE